MSTEHNEESTVISMVDYLLTKRKKLAEKANVLIEKAKKVSRRPDPNDDPFASAVMKKVKPLEEEIAKLDNHISFILRNSFDPPIPRMEKPEEQPPVRLLFTPHPPVKITFNPDN